MKIGTVAEGCQPAGSPQKTSTKQRRDISTGLLRQQRFPGTQITFGSLKTSAKYLPGDCWEQEVFGNDPRSDLTFAIERVLDRIEIKFRVVTQQYLVTQRNLVA